MHQQQVSDVFQSAADSKRLSLRVVTEHRDTRAAAHYDLRLSHSKPVVENLQVEANKSIFTSYTSYFLLSRLSHPNASNGIPPLNYPKNPRDTKEKKTSLLRLG